LYGRQPGKDFADLLRERWEGRVGPSLCAFALKSSLIIGAYSEETDCPDKIHIKSNGKSVLTGTTLKGAIRARAEMIINTLGGKPELILKEFMGWVSDKSGNNKKKEKCSSRLIIEETYIENPTEVVQQRTQISRFTAGVLNLFDSQPLWKTNNSVDMINIKITIKDYKAYEAGLILLILKDLWSGDLPIGGEKAIGRGVLDGVKAKVSFNENTVVIINKKNNGTKLSIEGPSEKLEEFVKAFHNHIENIENIEN
ncbi:MAG: RAMP superfamily CRISPR-associated protein, partial [Candidatus Magnetoovum sp. WYHC-5]|nr:RAMP superfamily CRISPR-associated protein [Candidatus Magnetoovum sp. WYHC-5]